MPRPTVLVYPGAGSDRNHARLIAIEKRFGSAASVHRFDFPYRRLGRRGPPDRAPVLMASIRDDLAQFSRRRGPIVLVGHSMGGRMASMVAADVDGAGPVSRLAGVAMLSYPLHPPKRPDRLRVEHLANITVPCLFVSGTRDQFGSPSELRGWTATIAGPVDHVWIEGGRHDLARADAEVADAVVEFVGRVTSR